eukprot:s931_g16.t3
MFTTETHGGGVAAAGMDGQGLIGGQGVAGIEKTMKWKLFFFIGSLIVLVTGVSCTLFWTVAPAQFMTTLFLLLFGVLMVVLDFPIPNPTQRDWPNLVSIRDHCYKFVLFMTRFMGRGMWYLFLATMVFAALWDTNISWTLYLVPGVVGCSCFVERPWWLYLKEHCCYLISMQLDKARNILLREKGLLNAPFNHQSTSASQIEDDNPVPAKFALQEFNYWVTPGLMLMGLSLLQKLHLGHNRLARIDSLESCTQLEELMVPHQQPPVEAPLQFCPTSIAAISSTLNVLNTAGNRLEDLQELTPLRLTTLDLSENKIRQVGELKDVISGDVLRRVNLQGNPFAFHERRYRTAVVLCSTAIEEIDGREVLPQERDFVRRLDEQKRKLNAQRKKHLNRAATDGRPRNLGAMPDKGSGRQLKPAEGESWGLQDWKF